MGWDSFCASWARLVTMVRSRSSSTRSLPTPLPPCAKGSAKYKDSWTSSRVRQHAGLRCPHSGKSGYCSPKNLFGSGRTSDMVERSRLVLLSFALDLQTKRTGGESLLPPPERSVGKGKLMSTASAIVSDAAHEPEATVRESVAGRLGWRWTNRLR